MNEIRATDSTAVCPGSATPLPFTATGVPATPPVEQSALEYTVKVTVPVGVPPACVPVTVAESCTVDPIAADVITPWDEYTFAVQADVSRVSRLRHKHQLVDTRKEVVG